jgi:hypothetical protein
MATTIVPFRSLSGQATSRRVLLRGAADLGAVVALGVPAALAAEPDPFPELERQFWHFYRWEGLPQGHGGRRPADSAAVRRQ